MTHPTEPTTICRGCETVEHCSKAGCIPLQQPAVTADPLYARSFGYSLAMRVMQSDLYRSLDGLERAECDELIARGQAVAAHPPTRHCMCAECRPSFDDAARPPATANNESTK